MKISKNNCKFFATLCTGLLLTACTGEELLTDTATEGAGRVMYATAAYNENNSPKTRMSYEDDLIRNYMTLAWSEGDAFTAFISTDNANTKHEFAIVAPEDGKKYTANETFKCSGFPENVTIANGTVIDAIYPSVSSETSLDPKNLTLSLAAQTQVGNKNTNHLKQYDYMVGHATYNTNTPDELNFSFTDHGDGNAGRLASIYRITLTLPANVGKVGSIKLTATDNKGNASLTDAMALNFAKGAISTVPRSHDGVTLTVTDGTTDTSGENKQFIAYVMLYPSLIKRLATEVRTDVGIFTKAEEYTSEIVSTRGEFKLIPVDMSSVTPTDYTTYDEVGTGKADDPYKIMNKTQLIDLAAKNNETSIGADVYFKLLNDIALTTTGEWTPIGTDEQPFKGHFDGNGHAVTGITITRADIYQGLFGYTGENSSIKNLSAFGNVKDQSKISSRNVGILVGYNKANITACSTAGTIEANEENTFVGGLVGSNDNGKIIACYSTCSIEANGTFTSVGGLVGYNNNGKIFACYSTGIIKADKADAKVGGLVGDNPGRIIACYSIVTVTANGTNANVGSLVGYTNMDIQYCLTTGEIGKLGIDAGGFYQNSTTITGIGAGSKNTLPLSCHGNISTATLNTEGVKDATGTGFGKMNFGIKEGAAWLGVDCPYHWVAGSSTPVIAPGVPLLP